MRRAIETAPKDGKAILLEDDASGEYGLARWSAEANDWVRENGEPIQIEATHWYAVPPSSWARHCGVLAFSSEEAGPPNGSRPPREHVSATPDTMGMEAMNRPVPKVQRVAGLFIAALLALAGVSLGILGERAKVRAPLSQSEVPLQAASLKQDIVPQPQIDPDGTHLSATLQTTGLATQSQEKEQRPEAPADELARAQRTIRELNLQLRELASELAIARRETEMYAAQSSKTSEEKAQLKQTADSTAQLARELASQLAMAHREIDAHAAPARDASAERAQIKQRTESAAAELRQSLQQERDRAEALARDLASARREIEAQATLVRAASVEAAQIKQVAERTAAELRQSLQQERDRAEVLATDLAAARRGINTHAKLSSNAATQVKQTRRHLQRKRDTDFPFFRVFRSAPW
jgi:hypothetical protein